MKLEEYKPLTEYKAINWNEVSDMIDKAMDCWSRFRWINPSGYCSV